MTRPWWETTALADMDRAQWEALCDGCGLCCVHQLEDEETGELFPTNVACRMLDRRSGQCSDYRNRRAHVPDCLRLTLRTLAEVDWLPSTCGYVRAAAGQPLPDWHHLVCGDREAVHRAGVSVRGWTVSEDDVEFLEDHVIEPRA